MAAELIQNGHRACSELKGGAATAGTARARHPTVTTGSVETAVARLHQRLIRTLSGGTSGERGQHCFGARECEAEEAAFIGSTAERRGTVEITIGSDNQTGSGRSSVHDASRAEVVQHAL